MSILGAAASAAVIAWILLEAFESMVLPRRVTRFYRPARLFYLTAWSLWRVLAGCWRAGRARQTFLSIFGPLSLLGLFATWVALLVLGVSDRYSSR